MSSRAGRSFAASRRHRGDHWPDLLSVAAERDGLDRRRQHGAWSSSRPWFGRYSGEKPLFEEAGRSAVRLEVCAVDHQALGRSTFGG